MKQQQIMKEIKEMEELKKKVMNSLENAPTGKIRCEMARGKYPQYYLIDDDSMDRYPWGRYLRKSENSIAKALIQKEYDQRFLKEIFKREKELKLLSHINRQPRLSDIYEELPEAKKCLIEPYVLTNEEFVREWEQKRLEVRNSYPIINGFFTEKGEEVRSKSEKMIADKFYMRGVPYKYEAGLQLGKKGIVFPDFTLLKIQTREEIYLEHFGMMDNPDYCKAALEKIEMYETNGIFLGEQLFATFESSMKPINIRQIDRIIDRMM